MGLACSQEDELETMVARDPSALADFYQTEQVCIEAVTINPRSIMYVNNLTPDVFKAALERDSFIAMKCAKLTMELVEIAIDYDGTLIQYIPEKTEDTVVFRTNDLCLRAVEQNGLALQYIDDQTLTLCLTAVKQNGLALRYCKYKPNYICQEAVANDGLALYYVEHQDFDLCVLAVKQNPLALRFVNDQSLEICRTAIYAHPNRISDILKLIRYSGTVKRLWQEQVEARNLRLENKPVDEFVECKLDKN